MCGIWGFVGVDEQFSVSRAWDGLNSLTDRGPDDWGLYIEGLGKLIEEEALPDDERQVILGNRRLSILDLSPAGNQPMGDEADGLWIVYNGEVYNYREIRSVLREKGYSFTSDSDTEVILRAYQEFGASCVERFRGMFAFAIYDSNDAKVFAARDRFGIKPFYYHLDQDGFTFASEVTALLEADVVTPTLDPVSVDGFLTFGYVPGPRTIIKDIKSLPPATTLSYDRESGTGDIDTYWTPEFDGSHSASPGRVRDHLIESVSLRLRSDVPVGAFLSGGLDSCSIVALMREIEGLNREDLHTFSINFDQDRFSERAFAESAANTFDTRHISQTVTAVDVRKHLSDIIDEMDQPSIDGVNTYFVSRLAATHGLKVVLSGLGSDELFYGYPSFDRVPRRYRAAKWLYAIPLRYRRILAGAVSRVCGVLDTVLAGRVEDAISSTAPFGAAYLTERGVFSRRQRKSLLGDESVNTEWTERLAEDLAETMATSEVRQGLSQAELAWYMQNQLLRDTDIMSMAHSLEVRVPYLDAELAEYVMDATATSKSVGEKGVLKDAVKDLVPPEILDRPKSGFVFPFEEWLRDDLADIVDSALTSESLANTPISPTAAATVHRAYENNNEHWSRVWALVVLSLWVEHHIAPRGPPGGGDG